jgi:trk system potassium uptake protein TrkH
VSDSRPILFILGILMSTLALAMGLPAVADAAVQNPDWEVFALASAFTLLIGVMLLLTTRSPNRTLDHRQAFVLTGLSWTVLPAFAALPLAFSELGLSYTDAFFEAMSGITTTGATVLTGLEFAPPGILLWRALLQWLGGIGIIAMSIAILPMLQVGGMQLFRAESAERSDKVIPRAAQFIAFVGFIYLGITLCCALAYWLAGMSGFEAVVHGMTTIATGGFSTSDQSIAHFASPAIDGIAIVFMILGSLPFVLYLRALRGTPGALWRDSQVRWFLIITAVAVAVMTAYLFFKLSMGIAQSFRLASFHVVSLVTGTGYITTDFDNWGSFPMTLLLCLMFIGGCAGSTTCGIKVFRIQILFATATTQIRQLLEPHGVFLAYYNGRPVTESISDSVMSFFFLYVIGFSVIAIGLGATGLDFMTATSGAATAISNVGPGLGEMIGPTHTFATLPIAAKWLLCLGMLLGRLELFVVLVMLAPAFWRR